MPVRPLRGEASCRPSASLPGVSPPPLSPPGFPAGMKESSDSAVTEKSRERGGASPSLKGEERPELRPVLQLLCPARPTAAGAPVPRGRAPLCPDPPRRSAVALPHSKAPTALPEAVLAEGKKKTTNQQQQQKKEAEKRRICPTFLSGAFPALLTPRWAHRTGAHGRDAALSHEHRGYRPGSTRPRGRGDLLPSISSPLLLISLFLSTPPPLPVAALHTSGLCSTRSGSAVLLLSGFRFGLRLHHFVFFHNRRAGAQRSQRDTFSRDSSNVGH